MQSIVVGTFSCTCDIGLCYEAGEEADGVFFSRGVGEVMLLQAMQMCSGNSVRLLLGHRSMQTSDASEHPST